MKKKITKVLSTGLALTMVLSMAACGSKKPAGDTPAATSPSSSAAAVVGTDTGKVAEVTDEIMENCMPLTFKGEPKEAFNQGRGIRRFPPHPPVLQL